MYAKSEEMPIAKVSSFIVTYSNGEILDSENIIAPLPKGVFFIRSRREPTHDTLTIRDLERGRAFVEITFGESPIRHNERYYYSTTLKNISKVKIKVRKFAGYIKHKHDDKFELNTITDNFFSEEQFREWYGVDKDGWIKPGQEVTDPNNYGGGDGIWAYYCVAENGEVFVAGAAIPVPR